MGEKIGLAWMPEAEGIRHPGLIIALVIHIMLFCIPMSTFVVQRLNEIEMFVIDEENPLPIPPKVVRVKKIIPVPKPMIQEVVQEVIKEPEVVRPAEIIQRPEVIQEPEVIQTQEKFEQPVLEPKVIEPAVASETGVITAPPRMESPPSPKVEVQGIPSPQPVVTQTVGNRAPLQEVDFGGENGPRFLKKEIPVYPPFARKLGKEGRVVLRLFIDEEGKLLKIEVLENPGYGFVDSAMDAVRKSTFLPAQKDGKPFAVKAILPIRFALRRDE